MALTERVCAFCNNAIDEGVTPVVCVRCHAIYHRECWSELERCSVYGCNESKDSFGVLESESAVKNCSVCSLQNPRSAQLCLQCGTEFGSSLARKVFVSVDGWRAVSDQEMIDGLSRHWESGVRHLYNGDVEHWFKQRCRKEWAVKAAEIRRTVKQRSIGLETFLQFTGLAAQPVVSINPPHVFLESSASIVETIIDIVNEGRGYLFGVIKVNDPWIVCSETDFAGNRTRLELKILMNQLPSGVSCGSLTVSCAGTDIVVPVEATRIGIENALQAYSEGNFAKARAIGRRLADPASVSADIAVLLCACYVNEGNTNGAVSIINKLGGSCEKVGGKVLSDAFEWYHREGQFLQKKDRFTVLEAMLPAADSTLQERIKKDLAKAALEQVADLGASLDAEENLWMRSSEINKTVNYLLKKAVSLDPDIEEQAHSIRSQYRYRMRKSGAYRAVMYLLALVLLIGLGYGLWRVNNANRENEFIPIAAAMKAKDFDKATKEVRMLCDNHPEVTRYADYYHRVIAARAEEEIASGKWMAVNHSVTQLHVLASGHFSLKKSIAASICNIAKDLEKAGLLQDARMHYQTALQLNPLNVSAKKGVAGIAAETDVFWQICGVRNGELGRRVCENCGVSEALREDLEILDSLGVKCYKGQMQVKLSDLSGTNKRHLIVCGNDLTEYEQNPADAKGHLDVYAFENDHLQPVYSAAVDEPRLLYVREYDLSGQVRRDLAVAWSDSASGKEKKIMLVALKDGKFIQEMVPGNGLVEFADRDANKRIEIWTPITANSGEKAKALAIFHPIVWLEPGFCNAKGNFDKYYQHCLDNLQQELADNPYTQGSQAYNDYAAERLEAVKQVKELLRKE